MADDLFTPTIAPPPYRPARPPWRVPSLLYPAVFGGPTAVTVLGVLNGRRLGLPRSALLTVLAAGLAGLLARVGVSLAFFDADNQRPARLIGALAGGLVWAAVAAVQKRPFRAYELRGGEPASLWVPGIAAVLACGLAEAVLIGALMAA
ncbi:hypothetical protein ACTMSW_01935 [Micromonospora sp. BQ11]|uniref:hypothetical protein n=1 Tax=Micromonospora sp. BQ11 TaxID=3452212 RepID=UPI003F89A89B